MMKKNAPSLFADIKYVGSLLGKRFIPACPGCILNFFPSLTSFNKVSDEPTPTGSIDGRSGSCSYTGNNEGNEGSVILYLNLEIMS